MICGAVARRLASSAVVLDWLPRPSCPPVLVGDAAISASGQADRRAQRAVARSSAACRWCCAGSVSFRVLAPLLVGGVVLMLWQLHPATPSSLIPMMALFQLALSGDRRRSLWMRLAVVPCVVVSVLPFATGLASASIVSATWRCACWRSPPAT